MQTWTGKIVMYKEHLPISIFSAYITYASTDNCETRSFQERVLRIKSGYHTKKICPTVYILPYLYTSMFVCFCLLRVNIALGVYILIWDMWTIQKNDTSHAVKNVVAKIAIKEHEKTVMRTQ